ncbi:hypothetical protein ACIOC2_15455 [Streptomyces sp. NPDC088337]|uniref:hypothetical protein n=1 Tax=unclassified Streptomyces TaxID=2593676 RepID=UPI002DD9587F|nr:hypothetical protein [Streptomyces sp. NBC_01788]WSB30674.1 hypothetical protein OIE49_35130 [Streptomyces sp. NBC_01788]
MRSALPAWSVSAPPSGAGAPVGPAPGAAAATPCRWMRRRARALAGHRGVEGQHEVCGADGWPVGGPRPECGLWCAGIFALGAVVSGALLRGGPLPTPGPPTAEPATEPEKVPT